MIRITCTSCQTELSIDDAFAGGVCRCQHCGTIQTVPAVIPSSGTVAQMAGKPSKTLYKRKSRSEPQLGSGLDQLADIVASSGLSGSGLTRGSLRKTGMGSGISIEQGEKKSRTGMPILIIGTVLIVVLIVIALILWLHGGSGNSTNPSPSGNQPNGTIATGGNPVNNPTVPSNSGPMFAGTKIDGRIVIYVIDRGSGTRDLFSTLKEATYNSIATLGEDRKFQLVFWNNGSSISAYPEASATYASPENLAACKRALEEVYAFGQSDAKPALETAMVRKPDAIVLATGKGWDLDDEFVKMVMEVRGSSSTRIYCFNLGGNGSSNALKEVAKKTGGEYRDVTDGELREAGK